MAEITPDEDFDVRDTYAALDAALAGVWDDPDLDEYADYDTNRPHPDASAGARS